MKETQATIYEWMIDTFPGTDPESPRKSLRALEEMVELCLASGATPSEIRQAVAKEIGNRPDHETSGDPEKIPAEAADVVIVLSGLAGMREFDLQEAVDCKMAVNRARNWKVNGDGTGYHVRNQPATLIADPDFAKCGHPADQVKPGPRIPLVYGTAETEVCEACGGYRQTRCPGGWEPGPPDTTRSEEF